MGIKCINIQEHKYLRNCLRKNVKKPKTVQKMKIERSPYSTAVRFTVETVCEKLLGNFFGIQRTAVLGLFIV